MKRSSPGGVSIGRILGVRILLHPSWFVIFALVIITIVGSLSGDGIPGQRVSLGLRWVIAIGFALLFFGSVLVHELAHALVARRRGLVVSEITLFIFGGAANLEQEAPDARTEALVAVAGPLSSLVLGAAFLAGSFLFPASARADDVSEIPRTIMVSLGGANLLLAVFNLIPGFPMDGGRLLRAFVWGVTHDFLRATRVATLIGRALAYVLIGVGFFLALNGQVVNGVWLAFIGWFLNQAAETSYRRVAIEKLVEGIAVRDVMDRDVRVVNPNLTLDTLVDQHLLSGEASLYPVTLDDELVGTVEIGQVSRVARTSWPHTRVTDVMSRGDAMVVMTEPEPLWDAVSRFEESRINAIPVVDAETRRKLQGLLTRDGVFRALRNRAHLRV